MVELKDGATVTDQELREHCRAGLASFKAPKTVEIWEALPRSALGKVLKREIRERYWQDQTRRV
ncbi:MAG: hypothetical protein WDN48_01910 [Pseudolabrys sp.]